MNILSYKVSTKRGQGQVGAKTPWLLIDNYATSYDRARTMLPNGRSLTTEYFREFQNYLRQAHVYWDAGLRTHGSAAALPFYYASLNLAKAELLQHFPKQIVGTRIHHGLAFNPSGTASVMTDKIIVKQGVFSLLVQARTGTKIPLNTEIPVARLLSQVREIGMEMAILGLARPAPARAYTVLAGSETDAWSLLALYGGEKQGEPLRRHLLHSNHEITSSFSEEWRHVFGLSTRARFGPPLLLESNDTHTLGGAPDWDAADSALRKNLMPYLDEPLSNGADALLRHGLWKSKSDPLTLFLIRYALMFYLSSVVRYKPAALDPTRQGQQAWLMDSFAREVPDNLLCGFLTGLSNRSVRFEPMSFRT